MWAGQSLALGTHLHFEFYEEVPPGAPGALPGAGGLRVIDLPRLDRYPDGEQAILAQLCQRFGVPAQLRWAAYCSCWCCGAPLPPWLWGGAIADSAPGKGLHCVPWAVRSRYWHLQSLKILCSATCLQAAGGTALLALGLYIVG